jgi:cytochrome c-type biogenesis protein CcmH/NrfF
MRPARAVGQRRPSTGPHRWCRMPATFVLGLFLASLVLASLASLNPRPAAAQEVELPTTRTVVPDPAGFEAAAPTDDPELEADVRKLAHQLRCPTCQALSIADSPSELAREMEGVIRLRLQEGMTPEEVRESFVEAYGEWILLSPRPSGFNLLIYVLPFGVLILGGVIVIVGMRKWLRNPVEPDEGMSQA